MSQDVSSLSEILDSAETVDRQRAAQSLATLGDQARAAAVALVRSCGDPDESVREWSVAALEEIGAPDPADVQELISLIHADSEDVSFWAVTLLGRLGESGSGGVQALAGVLANHSRLSVQQRAAWALGRLGPVAATALPALQAAAAGADARLARLAQRSIDQIQQT